jgi:hypothetical protein
MARRKPQRYRGIARICNAAMGSGTRFHVSLFLTRNTRSNEGLGGIGNGIDACIAPFRIL